MGSELPNNLKSLRIERGLSQAQVATVLGVSGGAYSTYELGTRDLSSDKVVILSKFYGVSTDFLYGLEAQDGEITQSEIQIIKKYRGLDEHGKKVVDSILELEHERCSEHSPPISVKHKYVEAARSSGNGPPIREVEYETDVNNLEDIPESQFNP